MLCFFTHPSQIYIAGGPVLLLSLENNRTKLSYHLIIPQQCLCIQLMFYQKYLYTVGAISNFLKTQ